MGALWHGFEGVRPRRFFTVVLVAAFVLAALERGAGWLYGELAEPGLGARWIWAEGTAKDGLPAAFFAVRDFELDEPGPAWLAVAADESYLAYLNGTRVGSGSYRPGAAADLYDVAALLQPGWNRLAVEVRSVRGAGGLLASLRLGERGHAAIVTGDDWRIHRDGVAVLGGWPLEDGEAPAVWRLHPTGRWRLDPPVEHPVTELGFPPVADVPAVRVRLPWEDEETWIDPAAVPDLGKLGPRVLFDWGEEVTGVLVLELGGDETGLVYVGDEPPDHRPPPADTLVVPVPGYGTWIDAHPRTFRYAYLVGVELAAVPVVEPVSPELAAARRPPPPLPGAFGVTPPRADTLAEEAVRLRLLEEARKSRD